jgi:hypothetical protein
VDAPRILQVPVVADDRHAVQRLKSAADSMSTDRATDYARALGLRPPSPHPGWEVRIRMEPDGTEGPVVWMLVDDSPEASYPGRRFFR